MKTRYLHPLRVFGLIIFNWGIASIFFHLINSDKLYFDTILLLSIMLMVGNILIINLTSGDKQ